MEQRALFSLFLFLLPLLVSCVGKQVYVVYFGEHNGEKTLQEIENYHHSYLSSVKESEEDAKASLLYSYKNSINGFAALLTPDEASKLSEMKEVVSVIRSHPRKYSLHTTRSWDFMGLDESTEFKKGNMDYLLTRANYGKEVIVGMLDSGVWPESKSFSDEGMGPVPKSWKGICQTGDNFKCNRKLIGARYYLKGFEQHNGPINTSLDSLSPRDMDGHGSHTASIVGGHQVHDASALGGFASGTASGGAPLVHLAIYKVCWHFPNQGKELGIACSMEDILAAIDDAIADGVNVLSLSIGTYEPTSYMEDAIAIGALHAIKKNIVVACSAGNNGPAPSTLANPAPWIITVGASSVDRAFIGDLVLGNEMRFEGQTLSPYKLEKKFYPLVYAAQVVNSDVPNADIAGQCLPGSLSPRRVQGKIVMCLTGVGNIIEKGEEVRRAGGVGIILGSADLEAAPHVLPATVVNSNDAFKILEYISSTKNSMAYIYPGRTQLHRKFAPFMASFTSRGPSKISPNILKPDITAPGLEILAAWSEASSPTQMASDHRVVKYNIISGTSMSCPHVAAAAALLKAIHPTWSSAAIRSALITSAVINNNMRKQITDAWGNPADPFQFGAGHLRPRKAADPGLVYDASYTDYLLFLCSSGVKNFDPSFNCPNPSPATNDLNYPSIAISNLKGTVAVRRTVTNVGGEKSVYFASVSPPDGLCVDVYPPMLYFSHVGQKKNFTVTFTASGYGASRGGYSFGWLTWNDGVHVVRSPMAVSSA
ncbi:Cucumisin [Bertholletia excelsa]